jgi:hypothetical protein
LIVGTSNPLAKIGQFFYEINNKCVKEEIISNYQSNEELFDDVGDSMQRCWYRYGEGQHDFLSNYDTQGRWCMLCGTIESSNDIGEFNLAEFVDWTNKDENEIKLKNGSKGKYLDYVNFKYFDDQDNQLLDIAETLETLDKTDQTDKLFAEIFEEQYQGLVDLKLKKITTYENQKNFTVLRIMEISRSLSLLLLPGYRSDAVLVLESLALQIVLRDCILMAARFSLRKSIVVTDLCLKVLDYY